MAPKKKAAGKKANDDWEAELGESPAAPAAAAGAAEGAEDDDAPAGGGGLMNLMRKNKEKRKKKGLAENFVEGEAPGADGAADATPDLIAKAPVEANLDDEFALPDKKGKGKQAAQKPAAPASAAGDGEEVDASGRVLTKAEKEKAKKEREKQRKKEQVRSGPIAGYAFAQRRALSLTTS